MIRKVKNFIWPQWYLDNCIPTTKIDTHRKKCRQDFVTGFPLKPSIRGFDGKRRRSGINELSDEFGSKCYEAFSDEGAHQGERKRRACQTRPQGRNRYGVWPMNFCEGGACDQHTKSAAKGKPPKLLQQSGGTPRSENADSICRQSNREASGTQDFCSLNFEKNTEVLYADSR